MSDTDDFEQEFADLDEKVILVQILTELQQIRLLLSQADSAASDDADSQATYSCTRCSATVPADKRVRHAVAKHKAPEGMELELFEEVEG